MMRARTEPSVYEGGKTDVYNRGTDTLPNRPLPELPWSNRISRACYAVAVCISQQEGLWRLQEADAATWPSQEAKCRINGVRTQQYQRLVAEVLKAGLPAVVRVTLMFDRYCAEQLHEDSDEALRDADTSDLKTFFQWLVDNAKKEPQQAVTLKQYFRILKMLYRDLTGTDLDKEQVMDVNNVSDGMT